MKSYIKLTVAVIALIAVIFTGANFILNNAGKGDEGRPYRVEAQRIAVKIENGDDYSLSDYPTVTNVEKLTDGFKSGDSDYLVKDIGGIHIIPTTAPQSGCSTSASELWRRLCSF